MEHHKHQHPSTQHPGHTHDYAAANQTYYDSHAHEMDAFPGMQELISGQASAMLTTHSALFDKERTTVLDFACGTGLFSAQLVSHVREIIGADISSGVVKQYNARAKRLGLYPDKMHAVAQELKGGELKLDGRKFDVIVCTSAYHHVPSPATTTKTLASLLVPGGALLVSDILHGTGGDELLASPERADYIAHKGGFTEEEVRGLFKDAGLTGFEFGLAVKVAMYGREVQTFLAKGVKSEK